MQCTQSLQSPSIIYLPRRRVDRTERQIDQPTTQVDRVDMPFWVVAMAVAVRSNGAVRALIFASAISAGTFVTGLLLALNFFGS